jgi:hypothetical protein
MVKTPHTDTTYVILFVVSHNVSGRSGHKLFPARVESKTALQRFPLASSPKPLFDRPSLEGRDLTQPPVACKISARSLVCAFVVSSKIKLILEIQITHHAGNCLLGSAQRHIMRTSSSYL